ncbi:MAG: hypothetical protein J5698_07535 [Bacteroidaceae bacterium]|nr:hypothetical protein [Bacteroidaceae bacterium]
MKKGKIFILLAKFDEKQTSKGKGIAFRDALLLYMSRVGERAPPRFKAPPPKAENIGKKFWK